MGGRKVITHMVGLCVFKTKMIPFVIVTIGYILWVISFGGTTRGLVDSASGRPSLDVPSRGWGWVLKLLGTVLAIYGLYLAYQIGWGLMFLSFFGGGMVGSIIGKSIRN
ncbi:MAG: hypothetical protein UY56_C0005G0044 [Parcubacteria group bacterium GW2011_GWA1_50_14]|uniref:Uncharacterized protein n=1 Tax=Candidatus Liptonbacteria bacterium GWB1_49_6 TaxID=1798644 RepID=A0A1G2C762_9BACT|nr:MAG: hypothetical protein UY56_C0005G0044 [Parcubacteria group bacterium GW2011_GWA1_50_14]OGY96480.1 MAG: hypothetical protein A2122_02170 [Candidatus Liptonbacteria bacterium GWB1_49_6]